MRVLHLHSGNLFGGVETLMLALVRAGAGAGATHEFALSFEGRLAAELRASGAAVWQLGEARLSRPVSVKRARGELRALLARECFDAALCHSAWGYVVFGPAARATALPLAYYMHAPARGAHWLERWARLTPPRLVVCNSEFTASTAARLFPRVHTEVVRCPVEPPRRFEDESLRAAARSAVRAEMQTPEEAVVVVQASRMEAWKGHAAHLRALGRLKDVPQWVCWLLGGDQRPHEAAYLRELRSLAARLGIAERVRFAGERADVPRLLAAADIYCQRNAAPEPFGIAFVEALYAGLPAVASATGGAVEIVDESCGALVAPGDADGLAVALRALIGDAGLRARLGARGPSRAALLCDPSRQAARLARALEPLAERRAAA